MSHSRRQAARTSSEQHNPPRQRPAALSCSHCWRILAQDPAYVVCAHGACQSRTICLHCFRVGAADEHPHKPDHPYRIVETNNTPLFDTEWSANDELRLIDALCEYGPDHWKAVAQYIGKSKEACERHYIRFYLSDENKPISTSFLPPTTAHQGVKSPTDRILVDGAPSSLPDSTAPSALRGVTDMPPERSSEEAPALIITVGGRTTKIPHRATLPHRSDDDSDLSKAQVVVPNPTYGNDTNIEGCMPRRGDLEIEFDDDAEEVIADLEIGEGDTEEEKNLKVKLLQVYDKRLKRRDRMKQVILQHDLTHVDKVKIGDSHHTQDEKELLARLQIFARLLPENDFHKFRDATMREYSLSREIHHLKQCRAAGVKRRAEVGVYQTECETRTARLKGEARSIKKRLKRQITTRTPSLAMIPSIDVETASPIEGRPIPSEVRSLGEAWQKPPAVEPPKHAAQSLNETTGNENDDELKAAAQDTKEIVRGSLSVQFEAGEKIAIENLKKNIAQPDSYPHSTENLQKSCHLVNDETAVALIEGEIALEGAVSHELQRQENPTAPETQLKPMPVEGLQDLWKLTSTEKKIASALHIQPADFLRQRDAMLNQAKRNLQTNQSAPVDDKESILILRCENDPQAMCHEWSVSEHIDTQRDIPGREKRIATNVTDSTSIEKVTVISQTRRLEDMGSFITRRGALTENETVRGGMTRVETVEERVSNTDSEEKEENGGKLHEALLRVELIAIEKPKLEMEPGAKMKGEDDFQGIDEKGVRPAKSRKRRQAQEHPDAEGKARRKRRKRPIVISEEEERATVKVLEDNGNEEGIEAGEDSEHVSREQEPPKRGKGKFCVDGSSRGHGSGRRRARKIQKETDSTKSTEEENESGADTKNEARDGSEVQKGGKVIMAKKGNPKLFLRLRLNKPDKPGVQRRRTRTQARAFLTSSSDGKKGRGRATGAASGADQRAIERSGSSHVASDRHDRRKETELRQNSRKGIARRGKKGVETVVDEKEASLMSKDSPAPEAGEEALAVRQEQGESRDETIARNSGREVDEIAWGVARSETDVRWHCATQRIRRVPIRRIVEDDDEDDSDEEVVRRGSRRARKKRSKQSADGKFARIQRSDTGGESAGVNLRATAERGSGKGMGGRDEGGAMRGGLRRNRSASRCEKRYRLRRRR